MRKAQSQLKSSHLPHSALFPPHSIAGSRSSSKCDPVGLGCQMDDCELRCVVQATYQCEWQRLLRPPGAATPFSCCLHFSRTRCYSLWPSGHLCCVVPLPLIVPASHFSSISLSLLHFGAPLSLCGEATLIICHLLRCTIQIYPPVHTTHPCTGR